MMKKIWFGALAVGGVVCAGLLMTHASSYMAQAPNSALLSSGDVDKMTTLDKMRAQHYFREHSFEFPKTFSSYHPGPYWMLKKKKDLTSPMNRYSKKKI